MNWIITGAYRDSGKDVERSITAATREDAARQAAAEGILVSRIEKEPLIPRAKPPESPAIQQPSYKLIPCPDCGTEISRSAPACPKCGRPMHSATKITAPNPVSEGILRVVMLGVLIVIGTIVVVAIWVNLG